ncbi:MAG: hypothetical protein MI867_06045 [Pseudomonadales bacterium]|nr:hypothetical protein [Pseudomonadales bacterium]
MGCYRLILLLCIQFFSLVAIAYQPNYHATLPESLKLWLPWVLHDQPSHDCPFKAKQAQQTQCLWPSYIDLQADDQQLQFELLSYSYASGWLTLPGGEGFWPVAVTVNDQLMPVVQFKNRPAIYLKAGRYQIQGQIPWQKIPNSLLIPRNVGLISLQVNDQAIALPKKDKNGRLWLVEQKLSQQEEAEDKLGISVYRHLKDGIPFIVETQVRLEVSGNPREALLGLVRLPGYELMSVKSPLPTRVEDNGRLRIQLRPGSWTLTVVTRASSDVVDLPLPEIESIWPSEELWSFQPQPELRLVRIEGAEAVDPQQTNIPDNWKGWKAYRLLPGQVLKLVTIRRGDPEAAPNRLQLSRTAWLDFEGEGLIFQDQINGKLSRDWRLNMAAPYDLGSVTANGEPQVVTELKGSRGIELRQVQTDVLAVSRVDQLIGRTLSLPASGWQQDFDRVSLSLNLPPGWSLLAASQADVVRNAWLNKWKVWDVFLVLITTAALIKLRGFLVASLSAVAFILIYPEQPSILWLWLNVIAVLALSTVLKEGSFQRFVKLYGRASILILLLVCIPFLIKQARTALYPQLERGYYASATGGYQPIQNMHLAGQQVQMEMAAPADIMEEEVRAFSSKPSYSKRRYSKQQEQKRLVSIDPNAAAQTGPSVPQWRWHRASVSWNGPVTSDQTVTLYLLKPHESRIVALARVLLLCAITIGLFRGLGRSPKAGSATSLFSVLALVLMMQWFTPTNAVASQEVSPESINNQASVNAKLSQDFPTQPLLDTLKKRVLEAKNCTPNCFAINQARLNINGTEMRLIMQVDALEKVQIALPHAKTQWRLSRVFVDGEPAPLRSNNQMVWLALKPGTQRVVMQGSIDRSQTLQLQFPSKVNNLSLVAPDWLVRGMNNGRVMGGALYLEPKDASRQAEKTDSDALPPNVIQPFAKVHRTLRLGLNWYVETRVQRLAPSDGAIKLVIPLISGESVTTQNVAVKDSAVTVSLAPGQQQFTWYSSLDKQSALQLLAPEQVSWVEVWQLENAAIWHVEFSGLAAIKPKSQQTRFLPQWFPLPGEKVMMNVVKPESAPGVTTTVDQAQLLVRPGKQESSFQLDLNVRSSKGAEQRIKLNDQAKILSVTVDGEAQPSQEHGTHLVIPINPGEHHLNVQWREPTVGQFRFSGPDLEIDGLLSNVQLTVEVPRSQWVLLLGGPQLGPAVLIWGELLVVILLALGLSRLPGLPLKTYEWVLLAMGLCAGWIEAAVLVVVWFVALRQRRQMVDQLTPLRFNLLQLSLVLLTLAALVTMLGVIPMGLMGSPDMGIVGNGSSHYYLHWYQDEIANGLPSIWWVSLPLWAYRLMMLLWSLWLAVAILRWMKWAWLCFSEGGVWKRAEPAKVNVDE